MKNKTDNFTIDPEAKLPIPLTKVLDNTNNPYYIGKLQWPGTIDFGQGVSFFVFVSEDGCEELQISPIDPARRSKANESGATLGNGRITVDLYPMQDRNDNVYYVGEVLAPSGTELDLLRGIFFTIFLSKEGQEELQITRLQHSRRRNKDRDISLETSKSYKSGWVAQENSVS